MVEFCIETERLCIKFGKTKDYVRTEDYVKVHEYDFNALQNIGGETKLVKMDSDEVRGWFKDTSLKSNCYYFIAFLKETNAPIADIGFDRYNEKLNGLEISAWLHPNYWGHGYMKEALISIMDFIYSEGYDNIIYSYIEGNIRSENLCKKIGFIPYDIDNDYKTNYGSKKEYINIMSKDIYYGMYNKIEKMK